MSVLWFGNFHERWFGLFIFCSLVCLFLFMFCLFKYVVWFCLLKFCSSETIFSVCSIKSDIHGFRKKKAALGLGQALQFQQLCFCPLLKCCSWEFICIEFHQLGEQSNKENWFFLDIVRKGGGSRRIQNFLNRKNSDFFGLFAERGGGVSPNPKGF